MCHLNLRGRELPEKELLSVPELQYYCCSIELGKHSVLVYYAVAVLLEKPTVILCVCVCVFCPFILDIEFVGRTSRGSHRISHPPSFCGACLHFSREKDSAIPFPRRLTTVKSNFAFCVLTI